MLRHLPMFCALGRERHFRRAAARLGSSQSAVSRQLIELESALGFTLVERSTRNVELTPAGAQLLAAVEPLIGDIDIAIQDAREVALGKRGIVHIGYTTASMSSFGAHTVRRLRAEFADLTLTLDEMPTNQQVEALRVGAIDIGLLHPPISEGGLSVRLLGHQPIALAVACDHPLAGRAQVRFEDLRDELFILYPRAVGPDLYDRIVQCAERAGYRPSFAQECASWSAAISLAETGIGVALVPAAFERRCGPALRFVAIAGDVPRLPFAIATRRAPRRPIVAQVRATIESAAASFFDTARGTVSHDKPHRRG